MLFKLLLLLAIVMVVFIYLRMLQEKETQKIEGFTQQKEAYVFKQNDEKYDTFYSEYYDEVHDTEKHNEFEMMLMLKQTMPSTKYSTILDIGCGTGCLVDKLTTLGYHVFGVDKSESMIRMAEKKYPKNEFQCNTVMDPMLFESSSFTHILCTYFTLYEIDDMTIFFRHCYYWLKSGGFLIVHLVEPNQFSNTHRPSPKKRIIQRLLDTTNYQYTSSYNSVGEDGGVVVFKEEFTDKKNKNRRENEHTLKMPGIESILNIAKQNGFIVHSKANLESYNGDENQYLYVFERIQGNLYL